MTILNLVAGKNTLKRAGLIKVIARKTIETYLIAVTDSLSDGDIIHVCSLDAYLASKFCSCKGSANKTFCSHLVAALDSLPDDETKVLISTYVRSLSKGLSMNEELLKKLKFIPTSLKAVNLQIGGLAPKTLTNICGEAGAGKSILMTQLSWEYMAQNPKKNVFYVGTEGGEEYLVQGWAEKALNNRYKITPEIINVENINLEYKNGKQSIFVLTETKLINLLEMHGFPIQLKTSDDGKLMVRLDLPKENKKDKFATFPKMENTPFGKFIIDHDIGMVVYDSLSMPNEIFVSGQVNFPGRDDAQGLWFAQMQDAAKTFNCIVLASTHITKDDTNKFDVGQPIGGKTVGHNFKIVMRVGRYMNPTTKRPAQGEKFVNKRKLIRERFFFEKTGKQAGIMAIDLTDDGYRDTDFVPEEPKTEEKDE